MPGELIVTGSGLADGYVGDETLTSARFISLPQEYGRRGYRTGDGARLLPSGDFDCLGRLDRQLHLPLAVVIVAAGLIGVCEVCYDIAAQTARLFRYPRPWPARPDRS
ncbi:hypothetical protein [Nonomuraea sp. NPDC001831]|uniref:hypothetical protein n=1 Tax=Nonomuraea sp. NPDC001831 TaxID=3364340 RepID=UPI00367D2E1A